MPANNMPIKARDSDVMLADILEDIHGELAHLAGKVWEMNESINSIRESMESDREKDRSDLAATTASVLAMSRVLENSLAREQARLSGVRRIQHNGRARGERTGGEA